MITELLDCHLLLEKLREWTVPSPFSKLGNAFRLISNQQPGRIFHKKPTAAGRAP